VKAEGQYPGLKRMSKEVLGEDIQRGSHCPVSFGPVGWRGLDLISHMNHIQQIIDSSTAMKLYLLHREDWEMAISNDEDVTAGVPGHFATCYY
jgi:hypothetical protein